MQVVAAVLLVLLAVAALAWTWRRSSSGLGRPVGPGPSRMIRFPAEWLSGGGEPTVRVLQRIAVTPGAALLYLELPDGRRLLLAVGAPATVVAGDGSGVLDPPRERREEDTPSGDGTR